MLTTPFHTSKKNVVHVIIETPRNSVNKYNYDEPTGLFKLSKVLPEGTKFPFDFGFIPGTEGGDGDPLDVMVLTRHPTFTGCLILCRMIGIIELRQQEKGKKEHRNDRLIAVPEEEDPNSSIKNLRGIPADRLHEWVGFFNYYKNIRGNHSELIGIKGPGAALREIRNSLRKG